LENAKAAARPRSVAGLKRGQHRCRQLAEKASGQADMVAQNNPADIRNVRHGL